MSDIASDLGTPYHSRTTTFELKGYQVFLAVSRTRRCPGLRCTEEPSPLTAQCPTIPTVHTRVSTQNQRESHTRFCNSRFGLCLTVPGAIVPHSRLPSLPPPIFGASTTSTLCLSFLPKISWKRPAMDPRTPDLEKSVEIVDITSSKSEDNGPLHVPENGRFSI